MSSRVSAVVVHHSQEPFGALKLALEKQGIRTFQARSCGDLGRLFKQPGLPQLVFTDTTLPDGTWKGLPGFGSRSS